MKSFKHNVFRHKAPVGLVVLVGAVAALVLVAVNPLAGSQAADTGASPTSSATGVEQLQAALAVLRRPASTYDALPPTAQAALSSLGGGVDVSQARRAFKSPTGATVYVVPSEKGVCLVDSNLSQSGCFPVSAVLGSGAAQSDDCSPTLPNGNTIEIAGIIPDGATKPTLILSDNSRQPLNVEENAYLEQFARNGAVPSQIEWQSATGPVTINANVPTDVSSERCATPDEVRTLESEGKVPPALGHPPAQPTGVTEYNR